MSKFKSNQDMPRDPPQASAFFLPMGPTEPLPEVVRATMTPGEAREYRLSDYPRHDWMDVKHVRKE